MKEIKLTDLTSIELYSNSIAKQFKEIDLVKEYNLDEALEMLLLKFHKYNYNQVFYSESNRVQILFRRVLVNLNQGDCEKTTPRKVDNLISFNFITLFRDIEWEVYIQINEERLKFQPLLCSYLNIAIEKLIDADDYI